MGLLFFIIIFSLFCCFVKAGAFRIVGQKLVFPLKGSKISVSLKVITCRKIILTLNITAYSRHTDKSRDVYHMWNITLAQKKFLKLLQVACNDLGMYCLLAPRPFWGRPSNKHSRWTVSQGLYAPRCRYRYPAVQPDPKPRRWTPYLLGWGQVDHQNTHTVVKQPTRSGS